MLMLLRLAFVILDLFLNPPFSFRISDSLFCDGSEMSQHGPVRVGWTLNLDFLDGEQHLHLHDLAFSSFHITHKSIFGRQRPSSTTAIPTCATKLRIDTLRAELLKRATHLR